MGQNENQRTELDGQVEQWIEAGLIDAHAGARILDFEAKRERKVTLRWPVILALTFGGMLVAAGVTLFVAAHWSELSPAMRFSLVLFMTALFHAGGAAVAERFPALSTTLHALGTVTLGAGIFLTAQIFNLHEDWATGVLLWAVGAAVGYVLLRDWAQAVAAALLIPAWLVSQWTITFEGHSGGARPLAVGLILTALCYLSANTAGARKPERLRLAWIGILALLPCVVTAVSISAEEGFRAFSSLPVGILAIAWAVAVIAPLTLARLLRGRAVWMNCLGAVWAYALVVSASHIELRAGSRERSLSATVALYILCALGSVGLVAWGLLEKRKERLNLGILGFAISILFFYFDSFMGKLGRSASLLILGVLCLAGGYVLEITRRRLVTRMELKP